MKMNGEGSVYQCDRECNYNIFYDDIHFLEVKEMFHFHILS